MGEADHVFEISFEICNKVGGIYTVIKSKAAQMINEYDGKYMTIGYYDASKARNDFDEQKPENPQLLEVFTKLGKQGIKCYYGIWLIPGRPKTILIDAKERVSKINDLKKRLWDKYNIDSLKSDAWFNDPVIWAESVGMLIEELVKIKPWSDGKSVAHFHEWLAGAGLLYLKQKDAPVSTVFTTHATILGRTIAASGTDLYAMVDRGLEGDQKASASLAFEYGVQDKHGLEVASAKAADVFSTVSEITGREATFILGRKPEVLLFNGLDLSKYPEMEEVSVIRRKYRHEMRKFLRAFFNRYYDLDFYNIRSMFISGRYEFHNKGIDVYIDALGKLNETMKKEETKKHVIAFIFVPTGIRGENIQVLKNVSLYEDMHDKIEDILPEIKDNIMKAMIVEGTMPKPNTLISDESQKTLRKILNHFQERKGQLPPLSAFELSYPEDQDNILNACKRNGLLNRAEDRVKVIFYPAYLSSADRLIGMEYDQATLTCDIGVFPSFYEPWGYTPLECAAQATLSITTDLAGYGLFMKDKGDGVKVLEVDNRSYVDIVSDLYDMLHEVVSLEQKELTKRRMNARELAFMADWSLLVKNYVKAHDMAVSNN
ncbi:hypothetical protein ACFLRF_01590 [Candidatus Altiarchaeota archaeon]